jgi:hypothetical protein
MTDPAVNTMEHFHGDVCHKVILDIDFTQTKAQQSIDKHLLWVRLQKVSVT